MATANTFQRRRLWPRVLLWLALFLLLALGTAWAVYGATLTRFAETGASYGARVACSCRYVGNRDLGDCRKDFEPGMELIRLSEDPAAKSVTASFPLIASETATYRDGFGCVLEEYRD